MDPSPTQMADHWRPKPGRRPGQPRYHWHMLFHDQPEVRRLAAAAQGKLAGLSGLDLVPEQWLHLTTFAVGYADQVPEAGLLAVEPSGALQPVLDAVTAATRAAGRAAAPPPTHGCPTSPWPTVTTPARRRP
jgi:hypothetical protein